MTHRIVIVGGGAGGLELATRLGKTLGKRGTASVMLELNYYFVCCYWLFINSS